MNLDYIRYWKIHRQLAVLVKQKKLSVQKHPHFPMKIYKYSRTFQYEDAWTPLMRTMRGAVYSNDGRKLNVNMNKFFNYNEKNADIGTDSFEIEQKLDGSMVQAFLWRGNAIVTTMGSFNSPQAINAREFISKQYGFAWMLPNITYVFEWMDPNNFTTLRYDGPQNLVLLSTFTNTNSSTEFGSHRGWGWKGDRVQRVTVTTDNFEDIAATIQNNEEGFVIRYLHEKVNGQHARVKIKGEEFQRLHRTRWNLNEKRVWQSMFVWTEQQRTDLVTSLDEEAKIWYENVERRLRSEFDKLMSEAAMYLTNAQEATQHGIKLHEYVQSNVPPLYQTYVFLGGDLDNPKVVRLLAKHIEPMGNVR